MGVVGVRGWGGVEMGEMLCVLCVLCETRRPAIETRHRHRHRRRVLVVIEQQLTVDVSVLPIREGSGSIVVGATRPVRPPLSLSCSEVSNWFVRVIEDGRDTC
jgi:hypothetical protein